MTLDVHYTMIRGPLHSQHGCILIGNLLHQSDYLGLCTVCMSASDTFIGLANGVSLGGFPSMASCYAMAALRKLVKLRDANEVEELVDIWLVFKIREEMWRRFTGLPRAYASATTIAIAHFNQGCLRVLNVGNTRVWLRHASGELIQLSPDYMVLNEITDRAEAVPMEYQGDIYNILNDVVTANPNVRNFSIHYLTVDLKKGDEMILCSDGIPSTLGEKRTFELFAASISPRERLQQCRNEIFEKGAVDDCSIISIT